MSAMDSNPTPSSQHQEEPSEEKAKTTSIDSSFPVLLPEEPCLRMSQEESEAHIFPTLPVYAGLESAVEDMDIDIKENDNTSTTANNSSRTSTSKAKTGNAFIDALDSAANRSTGEESYDAAEMALRNRMLTENRGMAYASTQHPLLELFSMVDSGREVFGAKSDTMESLAEKLDKAWAVDPLTTLKIIWLTRSIHLGRGERGLFYKQIGWLRERHPKTLLGNLEWIYRAVVKKDAKKREAEEGIVVGKVGEGEKEGEVDDYEVIHGASHGYWKDLLNILVLSAEGKLDMSNPDHVLLKDCRVNRKWNKRWKKRNRQLTPEQRAQAAEELIKQQKAASKAEKARRYEHILLSLATDPFHRALHLTVARLFADQLRKDMHILNTGNKEAIRELPLCAKWAPSLEGFHDKHTLIASTIAELLFPPSTFNLENSSRETYLKHAREHYRFRTLSPLRASLAIVERNISTNTFSAIQYSHVPSLAMNQYKSLFRTKDEDRFVAYLRSVAKGKATISGAVLTPGMLVKQVLHADPTSTDAMVAELQWKTLVQRIRDSGVLANSMPVCDVSGSMMQGHGVAPLHHALGLSLLMAEVTQPPFGGRMITFSQNPQIQLVGGADDKRSLAEKLHYMRGADWSMNTNFVAVFRNLILPLAVEHKVPAEDMAKRVFVFSDMQFDQAQYKPSVYHTATGQVEAEETDRWQTHHQVLQKEFAKAGYEMPELVYWNLAGREGAVPVQHDMVGTALVAGKSQGMMKVFLEGAGFGEDDFEEGDEGEMEVVEGGEEGWGVVQGEERKKKEKRIDPLKIVRKSVGHEAFGVLRVLD
ncbi:hypothetical protein AJ79_05530 [Helicocarpus griseus UAMH5409]|uniref:DUF2828 domain-containing protein n=1 Tax=Helicocarpus griseus UAMH5409 TaxID=1447875 RepID=A0A2B7XML8_9EURO|nr:hypothetical protein AJ79_05530 [Helicocarpus griseus UAMH5409]